MPATNGSATPSVAATATAASTALPPPRSTSSPADVASTSSEATAPPVPTATACLGSGGTACRGDRPATRVDTPADAEPTAPEPRSREAAATAAIIRLARNCMIVPSGWATLGDTDPPATSPLGSG